MIALGGRARQRQRAGSARFRRFDSPMMVRKSALLMLVMLLSSALAAAADITGDTAAEPASGAADETRLAPEPAPAGLTDEAAALWQQSQARVQELWQQSRESAGELLDQSGMTASDWWQRSRSATLDAWQQTREALAPAEADAFGRIWTDVVPTLEETLTVQEQQAALPERAWFRRDQADAEADINTLLDEAVSVLSLSPMQQYRDRIEALQEQITKTRAALDRYRRERVAAPTESLVAKTVADYDELIAAGEADIRRFEQELSRVKAEFAAELRAIGLEMSPEQVELLLSTVVGDNIVDLGIVFDNVKQITEQLERLVRESGEDLQSARRYYGMYVILLRALEQMHHDVEAAIAERYLPQIDAIAERADTLSKETRTLLRNQPDKADLLRANLSAQQLTIEAAGVYRDYLREQRSQVEAARKVLEDDIAAAWNTYETVRVSGELVDLVKSSQRLLTSLLDRQVPTLRPFQNLEMQRELEKLTEQLRRGEG